MDTMLIELTNQQMTGFLYDNIPAQKILEPDDDLRNAITMDTFLERVREDIHEIFSERQ
jgi:hypothetical protein